MSFIDIAIFAAFIVAVISVGAWTSRSANKKDANAADYFLAGRGLTWWLIGISLISANISAEQFVGMSGAASQNVGLAIASYEWMAAVTLVIVAFAFLPYFLKTGIYTIPGFLEHRYNRASRSIMAAFMLVLLVGVSLCGVIYAGSLAMREMCMAANIDISLPAWCWIMGLFAAGYVAAGGLKACAWTDLIQGSALILCGVIITYLAFTALGMADPAALSVGIGATTDPAAASAVTVTADMGAWARFKMLNADKLHMFLPKDHSYLPWTALIIGLWIPNLYYWGLNQYITQRILGSASLSEGQKGIMFAAFLKLIIPFIIVFPGLIAYNLYRSDMVDNAAASYVEKGLKPESPYEQFVPSESWKATANPEALAKIAAFNDEVAAKIAADNAAAPAGAVLKKAEVAYKADSAFGLLVKKLCNRQGLFGFIVAAFIGVVVSSLAAILNASSTIFSIDIWQGHVRKNASHKELIWIGRFAVGVFVVIGCVVAPMLDNPKFGGIFKYIQEFQGFVSPGILAVFVFGLLNRTATGATGIVGLLLCPVLFGMLKWGTPVFNAALGLNIPNDMNNRMAICFGIILAVMTVMGCLRKLPKPVVFTSGTTLDLTSSRGARYAGIVIVSVAAILYIVFR
jgi:SSS family solute:Na+ symporter